MDSFENHLRRYGPDATAVAPISLGDARAYCRRLARSHYENFTVVSWLLPRRLHQAFHDVYAYCRWSDDLADEVDSPEESIRLLDWWSRELDACFDDRPRHPVMVALRETIIEHDLSQGPFADLLVAFRRDQHVRSYATLDELIDYCRYSANPVGRIILALGDSLDDATRPLSDAICTGLQLANFWQDVARDFDKGRVYLPIDIRKRHGYTGEMLSNRETNDAFRSMMAELVADARTRFETGRPLIERVPRWLQLDLRLFLAGGIAVLDAIERIEYDVWRRRPALSKWTKGRLALGAAIDHLLG